MVKSEYIQNIIRNIYEHILEGKEKRGGPCGKINK
jgi:hypothetical protein